ncbi:MAG: D-alanyl-D-alanine carboxypeptidase [Oscillospiraceae bacterium]|nr:D-alanyl-D-alanine carboxypeptidase [Oscillospiraceae bacterium]
MPLKKFASFLLIIIVLIACFLIPAGAVSIPFSNRELRQQLKSETAVLIDGDTGQVLFEKNMNKKMEPASITKIMTGLLALENAELSDTIIMSHDAVFSIGRDTSHIALDVDEIITLEQALYALAIESGNDAANGIAEHVGSSMENFALLMTERSKEAGALNTSFKNAHGLPEPEHYTTAYDMAVITMAALKTPGFTEIFGAEKYEMPPTNKQREARTFWSHNSIIAGWYKYDGVIAGKTGWTPESQHTLVTAARKNGRTLIAVVMKSAAADDKYTDTAALLDYGFESFSDVSFNADELSKDNYIITSEEGVRAEMNLYAEQPFNCLIPKGSTKNDIEISYRTVSYGDEYQPPQVNAVFTLLQPDSLPDYPEHRKLGELDMLVDIINIEDTLSASADNIQSVQDQSKGGISVVFLWIFGFIGALLVILIILRIRNYIIFKKRRRRRNGKYRKYSFLK